MFAHVPKKFFATDGCAAFEISDKNSSAQLPKILTIAISCVGCNVEVYIKIVVKPLHHHTFGKFLSLGVGLVIDTPFFCNDFIAHDT